MVSHIVQRLLIPLLLSPLLVYSLVAQAAEPGVVMLEDNASPCAIMRALSPQVAPECHTVRPRSVVLLPVKTAALVQPPAPRTDVVTAPASPPPPAPRVYAFATRIQFAWNSAQVAPEAYPLLDTLAKVLKDAAMSNKIIQIEGHTDSAGSEAYNLRLSAQRAASVQRYLHTMHGIPLYRLPAVGKGKTELYDPEHPFDAVNRRVQFVNLTDSAGRR